MEFVPMVSSEVIRNISFGVIALCGAGDMAMLWFDKERKIKNKIKSSCFVGIKYGFVVGIIVGTKYSFMLIDKLIS